MGDTAWFTQPPVVAARTVLDRQYMVLGCTMGSSRMQSLVDTMVRYTGQVQAEQLREAVAVLAVGPDADAVAELARASWAAFAEPPRKLAETIDGLGVAGSHGALVPGAYGRLWCRHTTDAAWTIWTAADASWQGTSGILARPGTFPR